MSELSYRARLYPVGTWFALIVFLGVIIGQGINLLVSGDFSWYGILVAYVGLPVAIALWLGFKLARRSHVVPLETMDLSASDVEE